MVSLNYNKNNISLFYTSKVPWTFVHKTNHNNIKLLTTHSNISQMSWTTIHFVVCSSSDKMHINYDEITVLKFIILTSYTTT